MPSIESIMDHLLPKDCSANMVIEVPYLPDVYPDLIFDVEKDTFDSFSGRTGIDPAAVSSGSAEGKSEEEILCFVQSWCYFGPLLSAAKLAGLSFKVEDFLKDVSVQSSSDDPVNPRRLVTTAIFPIFLRRMEELSRPESTDENHRAFVYSEILDDLRTVSIFLRDCNTPADPNSFLGPSGQSDPHDPPLRDRIILSVMTMGESLYTMLNGLWLPDGEEPQELHFGKLEWAGFLKRSLVGRGWCKSQVNLLDDQGAGLSALYYLSMLDQKQFGKDHSGCSDGFLCQYETLDVKTYQTKHVPGCVSTHEHEGCRVHEFQGKQEDKLLNLVEREHTPLLAIREDGLDDVAVSLQSAQERDGPYVCISHVWQDGLGNPRKNALPSCQLLQIQKWVDDLYDDETPKPVAFWIDTICVPLNPDYRKKAIGQMFSIYRNADIVLVLDANVLVNSSTTSDPLQLFLSIRSSNWMRRLWTFQEGVLAQELYFQFCDTALNIIDMLMLNIDKSRSFDTGTWKCSTYSRTETTDERLVAAGVLLWNAWDWLNRLHEIKPFDEEKGSLRERLDEVLLLLCWRNTSWLQDEPVCYSMILGMDPAVRMAVAKAKPEDRMNLLVANLDTISANILFVNRPRVQQDGLRWMPKSFLGGGRQSTMLTTAISAATGPETARITPDGLEVVRAGLLIQGDIVHDDMFCATTHPDFEITVVADPHDCFNLDVLREKTLALLLKQSIDSILTTSDVSPYHDVSPGTTAALVEVKQIKNDMIVVQYVQLVHVFIGGSSERRDHVPATFEILQSDQCWLVQ